MRYADICAAHPQDGGPLRQGRSRGAATVHVQAIRAGKQGIASDVIVGRSPSGDRVTHDPMPRDVEPAPAPLSQSDIRKLLQGMVHDPDAPTSVAIEAFTATAASLYTWCVPSDVDAALGGMNTIQQISPSSERQSHASN